MGISEDKRIFSLLDFGCQLGSDITFDNFQKGVLDQLTTLFNCDSGIFGLSKSVLGDKDWINFVQKGMPEDYLNKYYQYHRYDPFAKWLIEHENNIPYFTTGENLVNYKNFVRSKIYEEFFKNYSIHHILDLNLIHQGKAFGFVCLYRPRNQSHFNEEDCELAKLMAPVISIIAKKVLLEEQLQKYETVIQSLSSELPNNGVFVVDENFQLLYANSNARNVLSELYETGNRSGSQIDFYPEEITDYCKKLKSQKNPDASAATEKCELVLGHGRQNLSFHIRHLNRDDESSLFIINIEDGSPLLCSNNEMRYAGLSEREIDVIHAASRGLTNREIAELLYISTNTVQSHLKSVYDKLGIRNRTSLISHFSNKKFTSNAQ